MLKIVYRKNSEARLGVENFLREYKFQTNREVEEVDPDSRSGAEFCEVYDITSYPTLVALGPDGVELAKWQGNLPTIEEVTIY